MINQLKAESYKFVRNKTFWVLLIITIALSSLLHFLIIIDWWQISNSVFNRAGLNELNGLLAFTTPIFFNLFAGTLAAFFISVEFSNGSVIKNQIISGSKRRDIFLSKYIVYTLGSIIITILIPFVTGMVMAILLGHGDIVNPINMTYLGRALGLYTLQFIGYTAIIILIAIATEDSGKTILFSIILTIVMFAIDIFSTEPSINMIYNKTIFYQFSAVFELSFTSSEVLTSILIALLTISILLVCGILLFQKKEIK